MRWGLWLAAMKAAGRWWYWCLLVGVRAGGGSIGRRVAFVFGLGWRGGIGDSGLASRLG